MGYIRYTSVGVLAALAALAGCGKAETPKAEFSRPVKTLVIQKDDGVFYMKYPGKVRASRRADLAFQVPGKIIEFPATPGDELKAGQLVARLDPRDFKSAQDSALAKYKEARLDFERYEKLVAKDAVSQTQFEQKRRDCQVLEAALKIAAKALEDSAIQAPFAGLVAKKYVENFQNVQAKEPVISLQDIANIEIVVDVPEADVAVGPKEASLDDFNRDLEPSVTFAAAADKSYPCQIKEFEAEADKDIQTYKLTFAMTNPEDLRVMPGMTATVNIKAGGLVGSGLNAGAHFLVPAAAVFTRDGGPRVWVVDTKTMRPKLKAVKAGRLLGDRIEIVDGLAAGDTIAVSGVHELTADTLVRPLVKIGE